MKKLTLSVLLFISIFSFLTFSSCGDDDHSSSGGGGYVDNVLDQITDPAFKECIMTFIRKDIITAASPDRLTMEEAAAVKSLHVYSWEISDLKGIEYFTGLEELDCSKNPISSLDLSRNTKLVKLRCNQTNLTSLNTSNNVELSILNCWNNKIESLNLSNNIKLTQLDCNNNSLKALDVSKNINLAFLDCCEGNISGTLDLSKCSSLNVARTSHNPITKINLPPSLKRLTCVMNNLSELDLAKSPLLEYIMCTRNPNMPTLDITNNRNLKNVDCGNVSTEPQITLYVWWDVDPNNMWASRPKDINIGVGYAGVIRTKK